MWKWDESEEVEAEKDAVEWRRGCKQGDHQKGHWRGVCQKGHFFVFIFISCGDGVYACWLPRRHSFKGLSKVRSGGGGWGRFL